MKSYAPMRKKIQYSLDKCTLSKTDLLLFKKNWGLLESQSKT